MPRKQELESPSPPVQPLVVDIGIDLTHKEFQDNWKSVVRRAIDAGVHRIVLTGTTIESSKQSLKMAHEWYEMEGTPNLCATVGVHPYYADSYYDDTTLVQLKELLEDPLAVAVGECGLDYNKNFSSKSNQLRAFQEQVQLAHDMNYPIFAHEREAHSDFLNVLDEIRPPTSETQQHVSLPNIVVHCFTGTKEEALTYIQRGYFLSFAGTICKTGRGEHLRKLIPSLPLEKIMVETDAPYMVFKRKNQTKKQNKRKHSEPADCIYVAEQLSKLIDQPFEEVCNKTTQTAMEFFRLPAFQ